MERPRAAISLQDFVKAKQHDSSYARKLQKDKARRAAKIKREYRRALKKEGYDPDAGKKDAEKGASSSSDKGPGKDPENRAAGKGKKRAREADAKDDTKKTKAPKYDRFAAARKEAEARETERLRKQKEREDRAKDAARKAKERKQLKRKLTQKTRKGQPILRHKMEHLLGKLEKELAP